MSSETPRPTVLTLKRQPPGGAVLLGALERARVAIRGHHPDHPPAQIVVGQGSAQRGGLLLGHLAAERWQPTAGGALVHKVPIASEGLARGPVDVSTTELHEAAHALALARGIQNTSRTGRYHNRRYRQIAMELGLDVTRDPQSGRSDTTLSDTTAARYTDVIRSLDAAITRYRLRKPKPPAGRNLTVAACACPRRIRVAPRTLQAGAITCAICTQPFTSTTRGAQRAPPGGGLGDSKPTNEKEQ